MKRIELRLPFVFAHPNRIPFHGCLAIVDAPSDKSPSGARHHRVILTRAAAVAALPSLLGMGINYKADWAGHDARHKIGVITTAEIVRNRILISGYVYGKDFPEVMSAKGEMGMSYELHNCSVANMKADVWELTKATFTGAAVLLREKAAYRGTSFSVGAA